MRNSDKQNLAKLLREAYLVDEMSPEEFAARNSHTLVMFASHLDHDDRELEKWFIDVEKILDNVELLHRARKKFLTPRELQDIEGSLVPRQP